LSYSFFIKKLIHTFGKNLLTLIFKDMKKSILLIFPILIVSFIIFAACGGEEKKDDKKQDTTSVSDGPVTEDVAAKMSVEQIAEKRADLDCQLKQLTTKLENCKDETEKTKLLDQVAKLGEELNTLNITFTKNYGDSQEDMEKHQKLYDEKFRKCE